ncbi:MAG TPA: pyridoxal phosphate-dependent aminotransferase [Candidatus Saccharimonadales bacterium]
MAKDLTQLQIRSLPEVFNFTDGHVHRSLDENERKVAERLSDIFLSVERERQSEVERAYVDAFYGMYRQTINADKTKYLFLSSASLSLEVTANYVRMAGLDLALIEPCFDNLANMFKRHKVPLESLPDHYLEAENIDELLPTIKSKAICIVSPNNPTGITYTPEIFKKLVDFCKREHRLLIIDSSFRAYKDPDFIFDEYGLLQESGIDYILIEDTGKTWPTKELKVSLLAVSSNIYKDVFDIYTDFLYHHSTVVVRFLTEFIKVSAADNLKTAKGVVATNRRALYQALEGSFLTPREKGFTSVAWLKITNGMRADALCALLKANGIFVLPGQHFYWNGGTDQDGNGGDCYIRVALARDTDKFNRALVRLKEVFAQVAEPEPAELGSARQFPVVGEHLAEGLS